MNEQQPVPEAEVDQLVRAYLQQRTPHADAAAGLQRIRATLGPEGTTAPRPFFLKRLARRRGWLSAAAALLLVVLVGSVYLGPARASPATLLRQTRQAHALPVDRCYLVEYKVEPGTFDTRHPLWSATRQSRLWTRGDRFWIESGTTQRRWNWGRNEDSRLWLAVSASRGIRFEAGEAPDALALLCDVFSMKIETLLGEVLADFDLHWEEAEPGSLAIRAELQAGRTHPSLRSARLEIDAETKVLQRVVLSRTFRNRATTTTYTLIDSQTLEDSRYQLEGHLTAPYQIFSRTFEPQRRRELLLGRFGQRALEQPAPEPDPAHSPH